MPILMSTPDMTAETWLGALAWAPGSQTCSGMMPALKPKPTSAEEEDGAGDIGRRSAAPARSKLPLAAYRSAKMANRQSVPMRVATR